MRLPPDVILRRAAPKNPRELADGMLLRLRRVLRQQHHGDSSVGTISLLRNGIRGDGCTLSSRPSAGKTLPPSVIPRRIAPTNLIVVMQRFLPAKDEILRGVDPDRSRRAQNGIWGGKVQRTLRSAVHLLGAPTMPTSPGSSEVPREPPEGSLGSLRSLGMAHLGEPAARWLRRAVGASHEMLYEPSPLSVFSCVWV
jgi:hypothetical protein